MAEEECPCPSIRRGRFDELYLDYYSRPVTLKINVNLDIPNMAWNAKVVDIVVAPEERRKGKAQEVWQCAERQLRVLGVGVVEGTVMKSNTDAKLFWEKVGFNFADSPNLPDTHWRITKKIREEED